MKTNLLKKCEPLCKRALMLCTMLVACHNLFAYDFEVDGIYYNKLENNELEVTSKGNIYFTVDSYSGSVTIPERVMYDGIAYSVTSIGAEAFCFCGSLTTITIPNSVNSIGGGAFSNCFALTAVTLPNSITSIDRSTFLACSALTSITIPESVTSIGESAFYGCSALTAITIPESVTSIGIYAFSGCSALTAITIPESVTSIGNYTFNECSSLTSIDVDSNNSAYASADGVLFNKDFTELIRFPAGKSDNTYSIPESVTSIGIYAFSGCSALTSVTIPNFVNSIGDCAFYGCSALTSVTIPNSVNSIGSRAFYECSSLTSITIPNSVNSIGNFAFYGCNSLTSINVDSDNLVYASASGVIFNKDYTELILFPCGKSGDYIIPNSVTSIVKYAFYGCSALTSVTIPNSVTSLGEETFAKCTSLTSVTIPNSVTSIGFGAFGTCTSLKSITSLAVEPPACGNHVFHKVKQADCELHVPQGSVEAYKAAEQWKDFSLIFGDATAVEAIEAEGAEPTEVYNLQGVRVGSTTDCLPRGIYIIRRGASVSKLKI